MIGRRARILIPALALLAAAPAWAAPVRPGAAVEGQTDGGGRRGRRGALSGVVNLNQGDEATLELLPGIGPTKAARIVEHRKSHPFRRVEELTRVKGIGRKTLARLRPYASVSGPSTLAEGAAAGPRGGGGEAVEKGGAATMK